jgi:hypothetical protein
MTEASASTETARREEDLEKGDHRSQNGDLEETVAPISESESRTEGSLNGNENPKDDPLSRTTTGATPDDDDPFSLYPRLSLSISSTQGAPFSRRNTAITLTHPLTREETRNTLKSVRSRFTEVRSEFDENVPHIAKVEINDRTISRNLLRLMKT